MPSPPGESGGAKAPLSPRSDDYGVHVRVLDHARNDLASLIDELSTH